MNDINPFSRMTLSQMSLSRMAISIMTPNTVPFSRKTLGIMTVTITAYKQQNYSGHAATVMKSIMFIAILPSVVKLNVVAPYLQTCVII
jgi:hypothetical protein